MYFIFSKGNVYNLNLPPGTESMTRSECSADDQCPSQLACIHGSCVNPCNSLPCGRNAYCEPENHAAWCRCAVGFVESPSGDCVSRKHFLTTYCHFVDGIKHFVSCTECRYSF